MLNYWPHLGVYKELAKKYYDEKTYQHALRVMDFVREDPRVKQYTDYFVEYCMVLGLCHDLFEDTDIDRKIFDIDLRRGIGILTRREDETYPEYCERINETRKTFSNDYVGTASWLVKLADMKDHLTQKETLTAELKEKYLEGMAYLL